ncbi:amino acid adenylation domain-containing protein [Streptantibioticus parmotrematis]|uniref:non-ribosomal peptide synthetase n=1 Tax=Streptantibioticus parmotrematis TaxID=2873249 RepID=UPI0033EB5373
MDTILEGVVLRIWQDVTGDADTTVSAPFTGHTSSSPELVRFVDTLRAVFALDVTPHDVLRHGDVREVAAFVERERERQAPEADAAGEHGHPEAGHGDAVDEPGHPEGEVSLPASPGQAGLWFLDQFSAKPSAYNAPFVVRFNGPVDTELLRQSLRMVVLRHEVLRTAFTVEDGVVRQLVDDTARFDFSVRDSRDDEALRELVREVTETSFDLARGPLLRVCCVRHHDGTTHVVCNVHHIVFDAASAGVFLTDWLGAYQEAATGRAPEPVPEPAQYREFVRRQRAAVTPAVLEEHLAYWEERLRGPLPLLDLPLDRPRPAVQSHDGQVLRFAVPTDLGRRLVARAAQEGVTPFMLLMAAYAVFLRKYARQDDICVGTPVSLRDSAESLHAIGYYVTMVATRHQVDDDMTGRELLRQVAREVTGALAHRDAPFDKVVERLDPPRSQSCSPLFQTTFVMPSSGLGPVEGLGLDIDVDLYPSQSAKYDLTLLVEQDGTGLHGIFEFDTALFDRDTVRAMSRHFLHVLDALVERPGVPVGDIGLLDGDERRRMLEWCDRTAETRADRTVAELFEAQAARTPDATALEFDGDILTYRQLNARANRMARALVARGAGPGHRVALHLDRSTDQIAALLGVLKSGASYVPLDPHYPADRVAFMLGDADVRLVVTDDDAPHLPSGVERFVVGRDVPPGQDGPDTADDERDLGPRKSTGDEIYVIYTSGSTGRPKGVVVNDATIANLVAAQAALSPCGAWTRTSQYMSLSFDVSLMEIFGTLCAGGTLVLVPEELRTDLDLLADFVARERIGRMYLPYIAVHQLAAVTAGSDRVFDELVEVASVGEQLVVTPQIREFFARHTGARLLNMYGPSETHLATSHELSRRPQDWPEAPPIGAGVPGLKLLCLDARMNLVPEGVPGELYIGGDVISPGYHNRPQETEGRYLADPFDPSGRGRLYRTGDLVRVTRDREFEYLGRTDGQIKIRGYRVEPAEVESALTSLEPVTASAVVPVAYGPGDTRLVGFVVSGEPLDVATVRRALGGGLPDYMLPSALVRLDRMPTTPSGKIDRKALPALFTADEPSPAGREPATPREREIAHEWADVLKTGQVGADDDFFALGGHSILATALTYRLRQTYGVEVPMRALFEDPTVSGMAARIDRLLEGDDATALSVPDLASDAVLPDHIRPPDHVEPPDAREVLLTGATGFLGAYLLRELLTATTCHVHCLVRAADQDAAWERLRDTATAYGFADALTPRRVTALPGDVARARFGLAADAYDALAARVGTVHHAAARINFVAPYASVKPDNVDGVLNVLEFASRGRVKAVHHMSTLAVFSPAGHPGVITEDSVPREHEALSIGYTQSKWVAERLALTAAERGLPVTVHRIGRISADSATGACQTEDFLWRQIKSFIQLGRAPEPKGATSELLPVDFVAKAVVALSLDPTATGGVRHLFHPDGVPFDVIHTAIRDSGHPLLDVAADEWVRALEDASLTGGDNALAAAVPLLREGALELGDNVYDNARTTALLERAGLRYPEITAGYFRSMIAYFQSTGELSG